MPVTPINEENRSILEQLYPKSLRIDTQSTDSNNADESVPPPATQRAPTMTTRVATVAELTKKRVDLTPKEATEQLNHLGRAHAITVTTASKR